MQIELKGILKEDTGKDQVTLSIEEAVSLEVLKSMLGVDPGIPVVACIGNQQLQSTYKFSNSDTIILMPVVAGG